MQEAQRQAEELLAPFYKVLQTDPRGKFPQLLNVASADKLYGMAWYGKQTA